MGESGNLEFALLDASPRVGNRSKLDKYDNLARDGSENIKACMNCNNFERKVCPMTDTELSQIDVCEHCCGKFEWWTGQREKIPLESFF